MTTYLLTAAAIVVIGLAITELRRVWRDRVDVPADDHDDWGW